VKRITVFPVPRGMDLWEAWAELEVFDYFPEYRWWRLRYRWPFVRWHVVEEELDELS
jgi:hypothetical protein